MLIISESVGKNGRNLKKDVLTVQQALNKIKPLLTPKPLKEDGLFGTNTANAILGFQKQHVLMITPDGRIDPGGKTINKLSEMITPPSSSGNVLFPFSFRPGQSYSTGMRAFGASRSNGKRKHAGVDLYAAKGTPIRAMKDGKVVQYYKFYLGTKALEIDHEDMLIRYGEISHVAPGILPGVSVKRGQIIAYVGELVFNNGNKMSMLHLEAYKGTMPGPLTVRTATPYQRRADLFDPTRILDNAAMN